MAKKKGEENGAVHELSVSESEQIIKTALENGVLLWVDGGSWGNRKSLDENLLIEAKLPLEAVRATQNLVNKDEIGKVTVWIKKAHNWARSNSLPWFTKSVHFVPKGLVDEGIDYLEDCIIHLNDSLNIFIEEKYDDLKLSFKEKYPKLYKESYYPTKEELRRKFRLRYGFNAITLPSGNGKVKVLTKEQMDKENQKFKEMVKQTFEESIQMIRKSFLIMVDYLCGVLKDPNKKFAESTVEKPKEFLEKFFENMNIYGDKPFSETVKKIGDLLNGVYAEDLRDDEKYRKIMGNALNKMVGELKSLPTIKMKRDIDI